MKKVLIFGANGFVARYLTKELVNNGYEVFGSDKKKFDIYDGISAIIADLLDKDSVENTIASITPDIIVNLAAISSVGLSWSIPQETIMVNVIGSLNILEAARKLERKPKIMLIGSSEEYVISNYPMNEDRQLNASNPYGISKIMQEQFARIYRIQYGLKIYCVRAFNHTGIGQRDSFVLPSFCKQIVEIERSGKPGVISVGNLSIKRDFSHVKDIVRAYRLIIESENDEVIYNVGSGKAYKLENMLKHIISLSSQKIEVQVDKSRFRPIDQPVICCDHRLISSELGWQPEYTVFDALDEMMEYYRNKSDNKKEIS